MYYKRGVDLTARLEPADQEVFVEWDCCPPDSGAIEGLSHFDLLTRTSDAVVLVRIARLEGSLTQRRDWITSTVAADVQAVLKADDLGPANGERIVFEIEEGVTRLGDTLVVARRTWAVPVEEGSTYLVFLRREIGGGFRQLSPGRTFVAVGSSYRPLLKHSDFSISVEQASEEILRSSALPNLRFGERP
jgi:hypothetical protein